MKKSPVKIIILILIFLISIGLSLVLGAQKLNLQEIFKTGTFSNIIFLQIRLPRTILALLTGILLAGAGTCFQMFFRNPLAEPGIMGISAGATLGAVLAAGLTAGSFLGGVFSTINLGAFAGALIAGFMVTVLALSKRFFSTTTALLLCGTALGSFYSALTSIFIYSDDSKLRSLYIWMLGSFNGRGWNEVKFILLPSIAALVLIYIASRQLDLLASGETTALSLGINVEKLRVLVIIAGSLATSAAVSAGGTIGFVGLVAPHLTRTLFTSSSRKLLPLSMVTGAIMLLLSDTISRTVVAPAELPVGTITALIGVPFFISLIFARRTQF